MNETGEPPGPEAARGVLARLAAREETLAVAESCTGGGLGRALTSISGASEVFVGGVIAYSDDLKVRLLEVPESIISVYGAVSKLCAVAMAKGAREVTGADWAVSVTGIAGPGGGSEEKPVGTVWLGISGPKLEAGELVLLTGDRASVRSGAVNAALDLLARSMEERDV